MADTVDLKSTALGREGSNPSFPTIVSCNKTWIVSLVGRAEDF